MRDLKTTNNLVIFQLVTSTLFLILKEKGYGDEQIALLLEHKIPNLSEVAASQLDALLEAVIKENTEVLHPIDEEWMVDVANRAVENNLVNGVPKYKSGQGYACAMDALRIAVSYRTQDALLQPDMPAVEQLLSADDFETVKTRIIQGAVDLFRTLEPKFGAESAAKSVVNYLAEKNGVVDVSAFGFTEKQLEEIRSRIAIAILGI